MTDARVHLNEAQLQELEALLVRREADLRAEVRDLKQSGLASSEPRPREVNDPVDIADERFLAGLDHVQLMRDQEELRDIQDARERMREKRFGFCEECDEPIPFARLLAKPTAKLCLQHQEQWENNHRSVPPFGA